MDDVRETEALRSGAGARDSRAGARRRAPDFESDIKFELKGLIECCLKENPKERPPAVKVALLMKKIGETESKLQEGDAKVKHEKKFRAF